MNRLLTAFLLWISCCCIGWHCAPPIAGALKPKEKYTQPLTPPFSEKTASMLFKAHFQYGKKLNIGGLLLLKQTTPEVYRVLLMAELGATLFDFEFGKGKFKVHRSFEALNRPMLLKIIENDIKLLLMQRPFDRPVRHWQKDSLDFYKSKQEGGTYIYAKKEEKWAFFQQNRSLRIDFNVIDSIPKQITLRHYLFPLKMELNWVK